ncbi:hypothetical protein [Streptomyces sp. NPDC090798]
MLHISLRDLAPTILRGDTSPHLTVLGLAVGKYVYDQVANSG